RTGRTRVVFADRRNGVANRFVVEVHISTLYGHSKAGGADAGRGDHHALLSRNGDVIVRHDLVAVGIAQGHRIDQIGGSFVSLLAIHREVYFDAIHGLLAPRPSLFPYATLFRSRTGRTRVVFADRRNGVANRFVV